MNRIQSVETPPPTRNGAASAPERGSFLYLLRVGALTFAILGIPLCAVFLPNVKKAVARTIETLAPSAVSDAPRLSVGVDSTFADADKNAPTQNGTDFNETPEPIIFADASRPTLRQAESTRFTDAKRPVASANYEKPADSWAGADAVSPVSAVSSPFANASEPANFVDFSNASPIPDRSDVADDAARSNAAIFNEPDATVVQLQQELRARGLEGAVVERWGVRFWRASGRTPKNPATGLAEFCEAIDVDPIAAAQSALDQNREKIAAFRTAPNDGASNEREEWRRVETFH